MNEITAESLNDLATKLADLDLDSDQQALLAQILDRAEAFTDETVGFVASEDELVAARGLVAPGGNAVQAAGLQGIRTGLSPMALKLGGSAGLWG